MSESGLVANCPHCGSKASVREFVGDGGKINYYVECRMCRASSADYEDHTDAIREWNKRDGSEYEKKAMEIIKERINETYRLTKLKTNSHKAIENNEKAIMKALNRVRGIIFFCKDLGMLCITDKYRQLLDYSRNVALDRLINMVESDDWN